MARVIAVCKSNRKGISKRVIAKGVLKDNYGLIGDAHASSFTHRQVSLLTTESINKMQDLVLNLSPGDFAENITCEGLDLGMLSVGTQISIGEETILEVTQIGKECHKGCAIFHRVGRCIMPREGIFARVIKEGLVRRGYTIRVLDVDNRDN
ncbi:MOSC domain-containing protein [Chloroflexota bacterium]